MRVAMPVDISAEIDPLLSKLGFDKHDVAEVRIATTPGRTAATVLYYRRNEAGEKHVDEDGFPETGYRTFQVTP